MTVNEAINVLKMVEAHGCLVIEAKTMAIQALEEIQQYRAVGTVEELQELKENHIRCEDCAGCTSWKCDCANVRDYAIREFAERLKERIVGMQMAELQGEDMCPCAENGKECPYINQDIGCQYCAREHTIKEINEIAEEMRGEEC